jgi:3-carboxy-cis,cis-muconate cycloisomerase
MRDVIAGLTIDPARMRANLDATRGSVFAERVMLAAAPVLGRARSHALLEEVLAGAQADGRTLAEVVRSQAELAQAVPADVLSTLDDPNAYLGAAKTLRQRLLAAAGPALDPR